MGSPYLKILDVRQSYSNQDKVKFDERALPGGYSQLRVIHNNPVQDITTFLFDPKGYQIDMSNKYKGYEILEKRIPGEHPRIIFKYVGNDGHTPYADITKKPIGDEYGWQVLKAYDDAYPEIIKRDIPRPEVHAGGNLFSIFDTKEFSGATPQEKIYRKRYTLFDYDGNEILNNIIELKKINGYLIAEKESDAQKRAYLFGPDGVQLFQKTPLEKINVYGDALVVNELQNDPNFVPSQFLLNTAKSKTWDGQKDIWVDSGIKFLNTGTDNEPVYSIFGKDNKMLFKGIQNVVEITVTANPNISPKYPNELYITLRVKNQEKYAEQRDRLIPFKPKQDYVEHLVTEKGKVLILNAEKTDVEDDIPAMHGGYLPEAKYITPALTICEAPIIRAVRFNPPIVMDARQK
ncbi:MAG: hypothetical protein LBU87_04680 [Lactobacillales bacterium]|nr:hypothetical protein [Lactobacillales bacterium]